MKCNESGCRERSFVLNMTNDKKWMYNYTTIVQLKLQKPRFGPFPFLVASKTSEERARIPLRTQEWCAGAAQKHRVPPRLTVAQ